MKKKSPFTLLEIIIVIFLITLITGAIGYNMKGTLDKGRAFRTEQAIEQLKDLFLMCHAEGEPVSVILANPIEVLERYKLAKNPKKLVEDGWGNKLAISYLKSKNEFQVVSNKLDTYIANRRSSSVRDECVDDE